MGHAETTDAQIASRKRSHRVARAVAIAVAAVVVLLAATYLAGFRPLVLIRYGYEAVIPDSFVVGVAAGVAGCVAYRTIRHRIR